MDDLERSLRGHLEPVQLICDAQIPDSLIDEAEAKVRPLCNSWRMEELHNEMPATLVSYFAIRGSERYEFNGVWSHLGVTTNSSRAGKAFLRSLRRLGLPTFEDEVAAVNARTYLAPILLHGAFPADVAQRFVERVERELRIGLVDASEARRRILNDPDAITTIRRPAVRLLGWAPDYAERLIDAVIDYIENPQGGALSLLPHHLQVALTSGDGSRKGLRRIRPPEVIFETWTGMGPELVSHSNGATWRVRTRSGLSSLGGGERMELLPAEPPTVEGEGREFTLFDSGPAWVFRVDGRPVGRAQTAPRQSVVLLPVSSRLATDQCTIHEVEHGVPLSGPWSNYRSIEIEVENCELLTIEHRDGATQSWPIGITDTIELVGEVVPGVQGMGDGPVFRQAPVLRVPTVGDQAHLTIRFDSPSGVHRYERVAPSGRGELSLDKVLGVLPASGTLTVKLPDGRQESRALSVVPGLDVEVPTRPLGPTDSVELRYSWQRENGCSIEAGPHSDTVEIPINGIHHGSVIARLPRVLWGLRSDQLGRLELAPGLIQSDLGKLTEHGRLLTVRCGLPADVGLAVWVDGAERQRIDATRTRSSGVYHFRSFDLAAIRDTLRANPSSNILLELEVDGVRLPSVACGDTAPGTSRTWSPERQPSNAPTRDLWSSVSWMSPGSRPGAGLPNADPSQVDELELGLRLAGESGALVAFLRYLGARSAEWKRTEFPSGRSATDWTNLSAAADRMWQTDGVRHRLFTGDELDHRLSSWARSWRDQLRRAPASDRNDLEQWLLGRVPPVERLETWPQIGWIRTALPRRSEPGVQWIPATVLYACVATAAGDRDAGPTVVAAAHQTPQLVLETVAFLLQATRLGHRFSLPVLTPLPDELGEADGSDLGPPDADGDTATGIETPKPLALPLRESTISCEGSVLMISPAEGYAAPVIRLAQGERAELVTVGNRSGDRFLVELPGDLDGRFDLQFHFGTELLSSVTGGVQVDLTRSVWSAPRNDHRHHGLAQIEEFRLDDLTSRVAAAAHATRLGDAPVAELFEDETLAARALLRFASTRVKLDTVEVVDELAVTIAPTAMLFSSLVDQRSAEVLVQRAPLLYAVMTERSRHSWRSLGWPPNIDLAPTSAAVDALVGWARQRASASEPIVGSTWRYAMSSRLAGHELLARTISLLERRDVDAGFIDAMVAMHRALAVEQLTPEATRMLLMAHKSNPAAVAQAALAGVALFQITNGS